MRSAMCLERRHIKLCVLFCKTVELWLNGGSKDAELFIRGSETWTEFFFFLLHYLSPFFLLSKCKGPMP